jgi:methyl-accepting chemotaxis protein
MPQHYQEVILVIPMVIAMFLCWRMIGMVQRGKLKLDMLPRLNWGLIVLGFVAYASSFIEFTFADACLLATAYFLCASAANPLFFLLAKTTQPATTEQLDHYEAAANSTALLAVGLALIFGAAGTLAFANETRERNSREEHLTERVANLEKSSLLNQSRRDLEDMKQNLNSKTGELNGLITTINERLKEVDRNIQQLQAGDARDSRVGDLVSKMEALAASIKQEADDIRQQAQTLGENGKKIAELDAIVHRPVPPDKNSRARPAPGAKIRRPGRAL